MKLFKNLLLLFLVAFATTLVDAQNINDKYAQQIESQETGIIPVKVGNKWKKLGTDDKRFNILRTPYGNVATMDSTLVLNTSRNIYPYRYFNKLYTQRDNTRVNYKVLAYGDSVGRSKWVHYGRKLHANLGGNASIETSTASFANEELLSFSANLTDNEYSKWVNGNVYEFAANTVYNVSALAGYSTCISDTIHVFIEPQSSGNFYFKYGDDTSSVSLVTGEALAYLKIIPSSEVNFSNIKVWSDVVTTVLKPQSFTDDKSGIQEINLSEGGLALSNANAANLQLLFFCKKLDIDLIQFEFKDLGWKAALTDLSNEVLDSLTNKTDIFIVGTSPSSSSTFMVQYNYDSYIIAKERGYIYFDGFTPYRSYTTVNNAEMGGDGVHLSQNANLFIANLILKDIFASSEAYAYSNASNDITKPSFLGNNTRIAGASNEKGIKIFNDNTSFNLDYSIEFPRKLSFKSVDNSNTPFSIGGNLSTDPPNFEGKVFKIGDSFIKERTSKIIHFTSNYNSSYDVALQLGTINLQNQTIQTAGSGAFANLYFDSFLKYRIGGAVSQVATTTGNLAPSNFLFPELSYVPSSSTNLLAEAASSSILSVWVKGDFIYVKTDASNLKRVSLATF